MQIMKYRVLVIGAYLDIANRQEGTTIHVSMKKSEARTTMSTVREAMAPPKKHKVLTSTIIPSSVSA